MKILKIKKYSYSLTILLVFFLCLPIAAFAITDPAASTKHTFLLNVPIGKLTEFTIDANAGNNGSDILGLYIQAWYGFLLGTIGILATVMIMWGGFKYLTSRGDKGVIDTAKAQIISAITGVALAFGTYSILMLINPQLLTITTPNLPGLQGGGNVSLQQQLGVDELTVNSSNASGTTGRGGTQYDGKSGPYGFGNGLPNLPAPGGPNIPASTRQIETAISTATGYNPNDDIRSNSTGSFHVNGSAVDYPINSQTTTYFNQLTNGVTPVPDSKGWGDIYTVHNAVIGGVTYPTIRVIYEAHCYHIDQGRLLK